MHQKQYDLANPVCWREVLKNMEWSLKIRSTTAVNAIWNVNRDRLHNYPEELDVDLRKALFACDEVFKQYRILCSLWRFLHYKVKTPKQFGLSEFMLFYLENKENPRSEDLVTQHYEDSDANE